MFKKATKIFTKKIITDAKEEVNQSVTKQVSMILSVITAGITLLMLLEEPQSTKVNVVKKPTINKYYILVGGTKE